MDWAAHFKNISGDNSQSNRIPGDVVQFGTILGDHTAHELSDLILAKAVNIEDLVNAYNGIVDQIDTSDLVWQRWIHDYSSFLTNWAREYANAQTLVNLSQNRLMYPLGWDYVSAENNWQNVLKVFDPTGTNHSIFGDLWARWASLPNNPNPTPATRPVPQPTANDTDLHMYQAVDQTIRDLGLPPTLPNLNPLKIPTWVYVSGVAVLGFVVVYPLLSPFLFPLAAARHMFRDH